MTKGDVRLAIVAPSGRTLVEGGAAARATVTETGWHSVRIDASRSAKGSANFELRITYLGTDGV